MTKASFPAWQAGPSGYSRMLPAGGCQNDRPQHRFSPRPRSEPADSGGAGFVDPVADRPGRSEEHTSELQSLMRISYAVFCLKKKQTNTPTIQKTSIQLKTIT